MNASPSTLVAALAAVLTFPFLTPSASAQFRIERSLIVSTANRSSADSNGADPDTLELRAGNIKPVQLEDSKSPGLAVLLSAVLPGAGQVYAEHYWTIPIFWGFGYYFGKTYSDENKLYHQYQKSFTASLAADSVNHTGDPNLLSYRDFYRDERDRFAIYFVLTYIVDIVDAYVGASLYSFDVSDNLGGSSKLTLRIPMETIIHPSRR